MVTSILSISSWAFESRFLESAYTWATPAAFKKTITLNQNELNDLCSRDFRTTDSAQKIIDAYIKNLIKKVEEIRQSSFYSQKIHSHLCHVTNMIITIATRTFFTLAGFIYDTPLLLLYIGEYTFSYLNSAPDDIQSKCLQKIKSFAFSFFFNLAFILPVLFSIYTPLIASYISPDILDFLFLVIGTLLALLLQQIGLELFSGPSVSIRLDVSQKLAFLLKKNYGIALSENNQGQRLSEVLIIPTLVGENRAVTAFKIAEELNALISNQLTFQLLDILNLDYPENWTTFEDQINNAWSYEKPPSYEDFLVFCQIHLKPEPNTNLDLFLKGFEIHLKLSEKAKDLIPDYTTSKENISPILINYINNRERNLKSIKKEIDLLKVLISEQSKQPLKDLLSRCQLNTNPYIILGLAPRTSKEVTLARYRELMLQVHPDKNKDDKETATIATRIVQNALQRIPHISNKEPESSAQLSICDS